MDDRLDGLSMDIELEDRKRLKSIFPQCFTEDKLDIDKLLNMCGEYMTDDFERYEFKWKGKSECLQIAQMRSAGTLRPCKEESVNFDSTQNLYIEGDNLEVLKLLQTSYYRKAKIIYCDPPYNTGNDFIYEDDFKDPMARYKEVTSQCTKSNPETMGRFHTNWLNMMYPRLRLAANLLRDDGVCFISIDDNEVHNLRKVCDEVFGEENFVAQFIWTKTSTPPSLSHKTRKTVEYVLCYEKFQSNSKYFGSFLENGDAPLLNTGNSLQTILFAEKSMKITYIENGTISAGKYEKAELLDDLIIVNNENKNAVRITGEFKWTQATVNEEIKNNTFFLLKSEKFSIRFQRVDNNNYKPPNNLLNKEFDKSSDVLTNEQGFIELSQLGMENIFSFTKPVSLIKKIIEMKCHNDKDSIVLDFFSGSATTAHAVMQLNKEDGGNRRFIMVQLPELCEEKSEAYKAGYKNICEIGKERIRRGGAKLTETDTQLQIDENTAQLDVGFRVFKLDTSNLKMWDNSAILGGDLTELERRLRGMLEVIKDDRSNIDVVYEVMLKLGQDLCEDILKIDINAGSSGGGKTVYGIGADCTFIVCLSANITAEDVIEMAEYAPGRIIFSEQCFDNTTDKSNVKLILRDREIAMKML